MIRQIRKKLFRAPIFWILLFAFLLRIINISYIPIGVNNDELDFIFNAKLIYLTGRGYIDYHPPINITDHFPDAELPSVLMAPFVGPFPFSLFWARLPVVLIGILTVYLIYLISQKIIGRKAAVFIALATAINPWNNYFSRIVYDAPVTTLLLLVGFYLLLAKDKKKILLSSIFFLLGFHTYMGMMVVFPFFLIGVLIYAYIYNHDPKLKKYFLVTGTVCLFFFIRYLIILPQTPIGRRTGELIRLNDPDITNATVIIRRTSLDNPMNIIFSNKYTVFARTQIAKYLGAFNSILLFFYGDARGVFSFGEHGLFYILDGIFLILGGGYLFKKNISTFWLLVYLLLISPLPSTISHEGITYASRSYLMQPVLLMFIGSGIYFLVNYFRNRKLKILVIILLSAGYLMSLANFMYYLQLRSPVSNSEGYNFSAREMAYYASLALSKDQKIIVVAEDPKTQYKQYIFYTNGLNRSNVSEYLKNFRSGNFTAGNFRVMKCPDAGIFKQKDTTVIVENQSQCKTVNRTQNHLTIATLSDAGSLYAIYNDAVCTGNKLGRYPQNISFTDLNIKSLSPDYFCRKYIVRY